MGKAESAVQRACLDWLELRNIFHYRNNNGSIYDPNRGVYRSFSGRKGCPDIVCVIAGYYIAIEVKSEKGKLSKDQQQFADDLEEAGGYYAVVRSVDELAEDIQTIIEELSKK